MTNTEIKQHLEALADSHVAHKRLLAALQSQGVCLSATPQEEDTLTSALEASQRAIEIYNALPGDLN